MISVWCTVARAAQEHVGVRNGHVEGYQIRIPGISLSGI
jgi:hypothetical protein